MTDTVTAECITGLLNSLTGNLAIMGITDGSWTVLVRPGDKVEVAGNTMYISEGKEIRIVNLSDYSRVFLAKDPNEIELTIGSNSLIIKSCLAGIVLSFVFVGFAQAYKPYGWPVYLSFLLLMVSLLGFFFTMFRAMKYQDRKMHEMQLAGAE